LVSGEKVLFTHSSLANFSGHFQQSYVINGQRDNPNRLFFADRPSRSFGLQPVGALIPGEAVVNLSGEVAGIWDGSAVVSSDAVSGALNSFFNHSLKFSRPSWGFSYRMIDSLESSLLNLPVGAVIDSVSGQAAILPNSPAAMAGLLPGDIITAVNEQSLADGTILEEALQKINPGQAITLTVVRNRNRMTLSITPGELK
jgi:S1-C subfamily serine protease